MRALNIQDITSARVIADRKYIDKDFIEFSREYLIRCRRDAKYKNAMLNVLNHFIKFCKVSDIEIPYLHMLNYEVKEDFVNFLRDQNLKISTINHICTQLTTLLNKAMLAGYTIDHSFKESATEDEEQSSIYLTRDEIIKLYYFENLSRRQKEVRDLFVVGCFTGLRYSDYSRIKASHIQDDRIKMRTKKTGALVEIPMNKYVKEIIARYGGTIPKSTTIQQFNRMIKEICKKAGFIELIQVDQTIGHDMVRKELPKYELISSHTARRSAATNMYLSGIKPIQIMFITGHKTEKAFMRYIRINQEDNANQLANTSFFR